MWAKGGDRHAEAVVKHRQEDRLVEAIVKYLRFANRSKDLQRDISKVWAINQTFKADQNWEERPPFQLLNDPERDVGSR